MVPLGLADRLSLARAAGPADSLHVAGGVDGGSSLDPAGFDSVLAGIAEARRAVGRGADTFPLAARLEKRIPVAAGLAGGSSDAAAAIDGALEAWARRCSRPTTGGGPPPRPGSDVPFFLAGGPALVEGRGERVTPLNQLAGDPPGVLLVTPAVAGLDARRLRARSTRTLPRRPPTVAPPASPRSTWRRSSGPASADARRRPARARRRPRRRERPGERRGPARARACGRSAARSRASSACRSACPAPGRPSGRSILRSTARRRPRGASATKRRLGLLDSPGVEPAVRRRDDHRRADHGGASA